jgi:hypothetical protein
MVTGILQIYYTLKFLDTWNFGSLLSFRNIWTFCHACDGFVSYEQVVILSRLQFACHERTGSSAFASTPTRLPAGDRTSVCVLYVVFVVSPSKLELSCWPEGDVCCFVPLLPYNFFMSLVYSKIAGFLFSAPRNFMGGLRHLLAAEGWRHAHWEATWHLASIIRYQMCLRSESM